MGCLSIQTWPMFCGNDERKRQLIDLILEVRSTDPNSFLQAAEEHLGDGYVLDDFDAVAFINELVRVSDASNFASRTDCATMCVADDQGVQFRVWVAADFEGDCGLVGDSNQSEDYLLISLFNCFDAMWSKCVEFSQYDRLMKRI